VKGRPPTDPLICHVARLSQVRALWDTSSAEAEACAALGLALGRVLWPGPVTLVAKASALVAPCVTGGSGCVGVCIPANGTALRFLEACGVPVAAPSANRFGHVSPTAAAHVLEDLGPRDRTMRVVDGGPCEIGIESTVVRIHSPSELEVLRRGSVGDRGGPAEDPDPSKCRPRCWW
jgi:tRNA A37 threonylcarbamoyladenosine synthetase subunit TsaC/SUA5/YrdC